MSASLLEEYIETGNTEALKQLLIKDPQVINKNTSHQVSPLMLSCYYKKREITAVLLEFLNEINLHEAAAAGRLDIVTHELFNKPAYIDSYSDDGFTPLGLAAYFNHEEVVKYLLSKGADVNLPSKNGYHVFPLHAAVAADSYEITEYLLEAGAEVNVRQQSGATPLHSAAQNGNIGILILLLEKGADINFRTETGKLAADLAAEKGFKDIAEILV